MWSRLLQSQFFFLTVFVQAGQVENKQMLSPSPEPISELFQLQWSYLSEKEKRQSGGGKRQSLEKVTQHITKGMKPQLVS